MLQPDANLNYVVVPSSVSRATSEGCQVALIRETEGREDELEEERKRKEEAEEKRVQVLVVQEPDDLKEEQQRQHLINSSKGI